MANVSVEELIREIAEKNGVAVSKDDPILILHTINARLLEDSARAQQAILDSYKEELEGIAFRWGIEAKEKAERILNASLAASREAMASAMSDCAALASKSVAEEVDTALRKISGPVNDAKRISQLNIVASCMTFIAAAIVLFVAT